MMMRWHVSIVLLFAGLFSAAPAQGAGVLPPDFRPDPRSVQRFGPAYRYPQAGWIVLHIEGQPYERGYQHGRLLASEIAANVRCFAANQSSRAPAEGWKITRSLVNALFVRRYDAEYLEEMKGIAAGAAAAGARFDDRPIDLTDVVALNVWAEVETLDSALDATATGLEGKRFPKCQPQTPAGAKPMHCSAFAATGPATADGKIVFGHITMSSLYSAQNCNLWLDVQPAKGHRVFMQAYPGAIQSGMDYYFNDAGLLVCETTIDQTRFDINGLSVASRIRQALQYADTIDRAVDILRTANNGLYTNEWLLADIKTNEIAMFELGTARSKLYRSSRGEWFGGTEGFYWGCNNAKDLQVRLETIPGVNDRPANLVWHPSDRDKEWQRLYAKYQGRINADFAREAFTTPPLAAYHSLDAKFTTTDLARDLKTWALFGPPLGHTWKPTEEERQHYPEVRPLVSNPWTVLHPAPPAKAEPNGPTVVDLPDRVKGAVDEETDTEDEDKQLPTVAAWHGTLLPKTDADTWLATAFADYEKIVALQKALLDQADEKSASRRLKAADRRRLATELFRYRSLYLAAAHAGHDSPLERIHADLARDEWYRVASGKGVLVLHELRRLLGDAEFDDMMDSFGRAHAGQQVTTAQFQAHAEKATGKKLDSFFAYWLKQPGLPALQLRNIKLAPKLAAGGNGKPEEGPIRIEGEIQRSASLPVSVVEVSVDTPHRLGRTKKIVLDSATTRFTIEVPETPRRLIVDKYSTSAKANGGPFSVLSFSPELQQTLIVYGTADEVPTNREAAEALQRSIIERGSNYTVPIKSDKEVTEADLQGHHLLLIGRPDSNRVVERFRSAFPVTFGSRSFVVLHKAYAHPGSAVIGAAENPLNRRYSLVLVAGLSAESTLRAAPALMHKDQQVAEVIVRPNGAKSRTIVVPARELIHEFEEGK